MIAALLAATERSHFVCMRPSALSALTVSRLAMLSTRMEWRIALSRCDCSIAPDKGACTNRLIASTMGTAIKRDHRDRSDEEKQHGDKDADEEDVDDGDQRR